MAYLRRDSHTTQVSVVVRAAAGKKRRQAVPRQPRAAAAAAGSSVPAGAVGAKRQGTTRVRVWGVAPSKVVTAVAGGWEPGGVCGGSVGSGGGWVVRQLAAPM